MFEEFVVEVGADLVYRMVHFQLWVASDSLKARAVERLTRADHTFDTSLHEEGEPYDVSLAMRDGETVADCTSRLRGLLEPLYPDAEWEFIGREEAEVLLPHLPMPEDVADSPADG